MQSEGNKTFVRVTQQMIYEQQLKHEEKLHEILEQTKRTNGRVTQLESRSIGMWIAEHPWKFTATALVMLSFLISDIRHPIVDFIIKLFI
jgi:hypothetical protein